MDLAALLRATSRIAVVGLSSRPTRTSHRIAAYLQEAGYRILPINPHVDEVLGEQAYPTLQAIPPALMPDLVNVFRRPEFTASVVRDVLEVFPPDQRPVVWTQIGVSSKEAAMLAQEHELTYIANRCIMVDHQRLLG